MEMDGNANLDPGFSWYTKSYHEIIGGIKLWQCNVM